MYKLRNHPINFIFSILQDVDPNNTINLITGPKLRGRGGWISFSEKPMFNLLFKPSYFTCFLLNVDKKSKVANNQILQVEKLV